MRWLLRGEQYDTATAYRIGLVQNVTEPGRRLERALELGVGNVIRLEPLGCGARGAGPGLGAEGPVGSLNRM